LLFFLEDLRLNANFAGMAKERIQKQTAVITNIRSRRLEMDYSQRYVGSFLGISQHAYSKIEHGFSKLTVQQLFQLAHILDTAVEQLLKGEEYEQEEK
jgi:transcriptional regulator with XRE-family HTH domain